VLAPTGYQLIPSEVTNNGQTYTVDGLLLDPSRVGALDLPPIHHISIAPANQSSPDSPFIANIKDRGVEHVYQKINCTGNPEDYAFSLRQGCLYDQSGTRLLYHPDYWEVTEMYVPEGTVSIGENAFISCLYLTDVYLPESVTEIADNSFLPGVKIHSLSEARSTLVDKAG